MEPGRGRQTHEAQRRAGEQHENRRVNAGGHRIEQTGQRSGGRREQSRSQGHHHAGGEHLQGSETLITPMTADQGASDVQRGDTERYRYGGEARSTHGHANEPRGGWPQSDAGGQQGTRGGQRTGGRQGTESRQETGGPRTTGSRQGTGSHQQHTGGRQQRTGRQGAGGREGTGQQHTGGRQGRSGKRDTSEQRRRYANSTDQTQYGGTLEDEPNAVEQTRMRENQSRTEGRVEGSHQNRRRHGTPQAEQGRSTRQGRQGSPNERQSGQTETHGRMQFGGEKGGSERDRRYGSRHGHGSERRR